MREIGGVGALARTAAIALLTVGMVGPLCGQSADESAKRREGNQAVVHIGPAAADGNGSFESGKLAPWGDRSRGLIAVVDAGTDFGPAAEGSKAVRLRADFDTPEKGKDPGALTLHTVMPKGEFSAAHGLSLSWQQRGPRSGFRNFGQVVWNVTYLSKDPADPANLKAIVSRKGTVPAPVEDQWSEVKVVAAPPEKHLGWDGSGVSVTLQMRIDTTDSSGKYESFVDDIRLTRRPVDPWVIQPAYYPSYNKLRVGVLNYYQDQTQAKVSLSDAAGKTVWQQPIAMQAGEGAQAMEVPELEGAYTLKVESPDGKYSATYPIVRQRFAWEKNQLGITEQVLPPFAPVRVEGQTARVVLRDYQMSPLGLFASVKSLDQSLLSRPMELVADGAKVTGGRGGFVASKDTAAVYEGKASTTQGVQLQTRTTVEYDGCAKVEMTLAPAQPQGSAHLQSLTLEIPLRDDVAPLWHVCREFLRVNIAGKTPEGEGQIWKNTDFSRRGYYGAETSFFGYFIPYVWLGNEQCGLSWFADNDRDWGSDPKGEKPFLTLHREGSELVLRVHLVQVPTVIDKPRTLTFGLMASPAKPMPQDWRKWLAGNVRFGWVGSQYWGTYATVNAKYPVSRDYGLLDAQLETRKAVLTGGPRPNPADVVKEWSARAIPASLPEDVRRRVPRSAVQFVQFGQSGPDAVSVYFEEHGTIVSHEEVKTFGFEWCGDAYEWLPGYLERFAGKPPTKMAEANHGVPYAAAPSYHDFAVWCAAEFIRRGAGIYMDNVFARNVRNTQTTDAYRADYITKQYGIQPSAAIFAQREYHKRLWVLHQTLGPKDTPPVMMLHMTNANILPLLSFNQMNLDLEWDDRPIEFQRKYTPELLRVESTGVHTGNIATVLANTHGSQENNALEAMCRRTRDGGALVHNARHPEDSKRYMPFVALLNGFGFDAPDCHVYNYWEKGYPLTVSEEKCKTLLAGRGGRLLLVLCTWNAQPQTVQVKLDLKALGVSPMKASDPEYGSDRKRVRPAKLDKGNWQKLYAEGPNDSSYQGDVAWNPAQGQLTVPMGGYGVRFIVLE